MKLFFNKILPYTFLVFVASQHSLFSQNVGINVTGAVPNSSALLDIDASPANDKGILVPRVALQATNVAAPVVTPATSLLVYNTATAGTSPNNVVPGFYYWDGAQWTSMGGGNNSTDWAVNGNANITATNFLGTTNAQDLVFKTNNTEYMRLKSNGFLGIGTNNPQQTTHIFSNIIYPPLGLQNTNASGYSGLWCYSDAGVREGHIGYGNSSSAGWAGLFYSGSIQSIPYVLTTGDIERMRINAVGEIGIGTTTPNAKTEIYSNSSSGYGNLRLTESQDDYARQGFYNTASTKFWEVAGYANNVDSLATFNIYNSSMGNMVTIKGNKNMGLYNSNPLCPLSFENATGNKICLYGYATPGPHYGLGIQNSLMQMYTSSSIADIAFGYGSSTAFTENVRIKGNGRVGILTNNPQSELEVNGYTMLGANAPAVKMIKFTGTTAATQGASVPITHGLTAAKILSVSIVVEYTSGGFVPDSYKVNAGYEFIYYYNTTTLYIVNMATNSANILSKPFKVLITYEL